MDARGIDALYRKHGHAVLRRSRRLLGSEDEAREMLQDVFLSLVADPAQFGGQSTVTTWLYRVTTNACLNRLRNRRTRARLSESLPPPARQTSADTVEGAAIARSVLATLPEDVAAAVIYHHVDEMTHEEIARVLGCSRRHVGDLLARMHASVAAEES